MTCADARPAVRAVALALGLSIAVFAGCGGPSTATTQPSAASSASVPAASGSGTAAPSVALVTVGGIAVAGPTCPVVTPSATDCGDRPVPGAVIVIRASATGPELIRVVTDAAGNFEVALVPGPYVLEPQPVEGLLGTAPPVAVDLRAGQRPEPVVLTYDTGIR